MAALATIDQKKHSKRHAASHWFPSPRLRPWKEWRAEFSCLNPVSQKKEKCLGIKNGFAVCIKCAGYKGAASNFGKGVASFHKPSWIRHATKSAALSIRLRNRRGNIA